MRRRRDWPGLGLAVQAYSKRALDVIDWVAATGARDRPAHDRAAGQGRLLGQRDQARQERGLEGYPVYTRKVTTDVSYLACVGPAVQARRRDLSAVRDAQRSQHRLHSRACARAVRCTNFSGCTAWAGSCMRRPRARSPSFPPVRVYAPVGEHKDLLAYLVRRLLENGANTSFVNRFMDEQVPVARHRARSDHRARAARSLSAPAPAQSRSRCIRTGAIPSASTSAIPRARGVARRHRRRAATLAAHERAAHQRGRAARRAACGHQSGRPARYRRQLARCDAAPRSRAAFDAAAARSARGTPRGGARARGMPGPRGGAAGEIAPRFLRPADARGGQDPARRDRRGARGGRFLPLLCAARARGVRARHSGSTDPPAS